MSEFTINAAEWAKEAIADQKSKVIACSAGLGSGKTHGLAQWHLTRCIMNNKSKFSAFIEPIYSKIHDTAIPTFRKVFADCGLKENEHYTVLKTPFPKIILKFTDQEIHFVSGDRPQMIIGVEYSHGSIDEAGDCKEEVFRNLRSRIRCGHACLLQLMAVGSPQGINWFAEEFDSDTLEGWEHPKERDHIHSDKGYRRFRLRTYDNPFLPDGYTDVLRDTYSHNKNLIRSYIEGIFCPLFEGNAYHEFDEARHVQEIKASEYNPLYMAWDFNIELVWTCFQVRSFSEHYARLRKYTFVSECEEGCNSFDDAILSFIRQYPPNEGWKETEIKIYGDRSGHAESHKVPLTDYQRIEKELRKFYRYVTIEASRRVAPETGSVEAVNKMFSYDQAIIDPKCRGLIRSLQATRWKAGSRKLDKPSGDTWTHRADSIKYPIYQLEVMDALSNEQRIYGMNL